MSFRGPQDHRTRAKKDSIDKQRDPEFTARGLVVFAMDSTLWTLSRPSYLANLHRAAIASDLLGMKIT